MLKSCPDCGEKAHFLADGRVTSHRNAAGKWCDPSQILQHWTRGMEVWIALRKLAYFVQAGDTVLLLCAARLAADALERLIEVLPNDAEVLAPARAQLKACREEAPSLTRETLDTWAATWDAWGQSIGELFQRFPPESELPNED